MTRGAIKDMALTKIAPSGVDIERFEDSNVTVSAFVSGHSTRLASGASVASNMLARNPNLSAECKFVLKDSPSFTASTRVKTNCA